MKAITKKLLLASVAVGVITPFFGGGVVHAKDVTPTESSSSNTVTVTDDDGTITATELDYMSVAAGYADEINTDASNNTLNIQGGTFNSPPMYIYGGYVSSSGNALYNKINITGGSISGTMQIYGGAVGLFGTGSGDAIGNEVTIGTGSNFFSQYGSIANMIYGGAGTNATNNKVYINGATIHGFIFGGGGQQNVTGNEVHINGGTIEGAITSDSTASSAVISGGLTVSNSDGSSITEGTHTFSENKVYIIDGTINALISGAGGGRDNTSTNILTGTASNNEVNISGGTINSYEITGALSQTVEGNKINISGGTISSNIWAGIGETITNNEINISGSPILTNSSLYGYLIYGDNSGTHSGNALNIYTKNLTAQNIANFDNINFYLDSNISNGNTMLELIGGSQTDVSSTDIQAVVQSGSPLVDGGTVTLLTNTNGITEAKSYTGTLAEGVSLTYPSHSFSVYRSDDGNSILAQIGGDSGGGSTSGDESTGGGSTSGDESTGGDSTSGDESTGGGSDSSAVDDSNNTVNLYSTNSGTIYGGYTETGNAQNNTINLYNGNFENVYGGYAPAGSTSGNVLNVYNKNISAQNVSAFDTMNFYIPNDASNGDTMLTLTDSSGTDLSGVSINAGVVAGNSNLAVGDTINLLTNSNGLTASGTTYGTLSEGVSLLYGVNVAQSGNSVVANITSVPAINETTEKIINDSPARDLGIIHTSNNFPGFNNGDFPEEDDDGGIIYPDLPNNGIVFNFGGGSTRTKTGNGSYVDTKTTNIDLGWERTVSSGSAGSFTVAPIVDYAHSNNDTYLADGTHGTGSTKYVAGGGAFRKTWNSGFYLEGSARFGKVKSDFQSNDMDKVLGQTVSYSTDANTISGHLGIGRNWRMNKNNLLHMYATYYHAHQGGMNADLNPYGDKYRISSADSGRFKIGYRMTTRTSKISRIYTGLAYQYEHISGVDSTYLAKNISTSSESISGSSGMLELGWQIKPLQNNPWEVNINATGWVGHQRGVTAFAKIQKAF